MFSNNWMRQVCQNRFAPTNRARQRAGRRERKQSSRRCHLRVEQLETRITPSVDPTKPLQLDGDVTTQVTTPATHDWDQIFADAGSPSGVPAFGDFTSGPTSAARAGSFETEITNSSTDTIFQGGGSK